MKNNKYSLYEYLKWRGDIPFYQVPPNDVDALIFSQIAYMPFEKALENRDSCTLQEGMQYVSAEMFKNDTFAVDRFLLCKELTKFKRFKNIHIGHYVNILDENTTTQFSAMCLEINAHFMVVAFRGTGDDIVGWREDCNLMFQSPIPAQLLSVDYLNEHFETFNGKIVLVGHSKGGNLALYSASRCQYAISKKIKTIYSFDGPGFLNAGSANYNPIESRIKSFIPKSSVVGILLNYYENYTVVDSDTIGLFQHNALTWRVCGNKLMTAKRNEASCHLEKELKQWLNETDNSILQLIVNTLFSCLEELNIHYLTDFLTSPQAIITVISRMQGLDLEVKKKIYALISLVISYGTASVGEQVKEGTHSFLNYFSKE